MQNSKKIKNLVEYRGISSSLPKNPTTFTQFNLTNELCIPSQKPDIERILKVDTQVFIDDYKIIKTPVGTSLEGQVLTGYKVIVSGRIKNIIMYVADQEEQSVHSAHFETQFCRFIVLPVGFKASTPIKVIPYVENVSACAVGTRCINLCTTLFLDVRVGVGACCDTGSSNGCQCISCLDICANPLGISKTLPENPIYFKEVLLEEELEIPIQKPDIEGLISITSSIDIVSTRIISTEQKTSLEGQTLSGCKLVIEIIQKDVLVYTADRITQPLHSAHYESDMRSVFVIVPCEIDGVDIQTLFEECKLKITPYIEDICARMKDNRTVKKCLTLFIDVAVK